jgi:ATP-binding cassette subfamily F protein 3
MRIKNLGLSYGNQVIFEDVNMIIPGGEKIGIVGVNGAGKTTLLKIMMGIISPDYGKIIFKKNTRIDWLPQVLSDELSSLDINVFDYLLSGRPIMELNKRLEDLYLELSFPDADVDSIYKEINDVQNLLDYYDVYNADAELLKIIDGTHLSDDVLNKKISELSGGLKSKVAFIRLLYSKPDVILLDEPTNHLDSESKEFITNYLRNYKGSVFVISHDTHFLDKVTSKILFLDKRVKSFKLYDGNYSYFKKLQGIHEENLKNQLKIQEREEKKLKDIVLKYSNSSGKRKRMAQDREKKLEKLQREKVEIVIPDKSVKFDMTVNRESSSIPIQVKNLCFSYDKNSEDYVLDNVSFDLYRGEKFLVVGENGVGKSTLLKIIVGILKPDEGVVNIGNKTDIGYYAQELDGLRLDESILDNFKEFDISIKKLRSTLGKFLFFGDEVFKKVSNLSPGERARVALAKLSLSGSNFLILDEPTNHLDPETQNLIALVFRDFKGTMIVVSHNPSFVDNLGIERTIILPEGIISYYNKGIVEYYHGLSK